MIAHPSSWRVNVNRQGEGLSCGGESIFTEEGLDPTEFPEWVERIGKPGDRGMSKSAVSGALVAPVTALPPSDLHVPARPGGGGGLVVVVVVNLCFTSLFGTKGLLSDIVIR